MYSDNSARNWTVGILVGIVLIVGLITFFSSMRTVDTGRVGVVTNYGRTTGRELSEGLSFVAPWGADNVTEYDVKTQKDEVASTAATKDLQDVNAKLVLNYQLNRGEVSRMHSTVGKDYKDVLILPALQEVFKAASAKFTAQELITSRPEVKKVAFDGLKNRLEKYGITVQDLSIVDQTFSVAFNQSIEATQVAQQEVLRTRQELEKVRVEADKTIASAQAAADAQRLQQQSISPELLEKMRIESQNEAIKKWNGQLPTYATGNGSGTFFNIPAGN